MAERTIEKLLERLRRLPPQTTLTLAQLRAQYERAQVVFPLTGEVTLQVLDTGPVRGEWLLPAGADCTVTPSPEAAARLVLALRRGPAVAKRRKPGPDAVATVKKPPPPLSPMPKAP